MKKLSTLCATALVFMCAHANPNWGGYAIEDQPRSDRLSIPFTRNGTEFIPDDRAVDFLSKANTAAAIYISSHQSRKKPTPAEEMNALRRALSLRLFLVKLGISPLKIQISFASELSTQDDDSLEVEIIHVRDIKNWSEKFQSVDVSEEMADLKKKINSLELKNKPQITYSQVNSSLPPQPSRNYSQTEISANTGRKDYESAFTVDASDTTVSFILNRWARMAGKTIDWSSPVDYPTTGRMRTINRSNFTDALNDLKGSLTGVSVPIYFEANEKFLKVTSAPIPTPDPRRPMQWQIGSALSLRQVMSAWTSKSGTTLQWESSQDFPLSTAARSSVYEGDFKSALGKLISLTEINQPVGIIPTNNGKTWRVYDIKN